MKCQVIFSYVKEDGPSQVFIRQQAKEAGVKLSLGYSMFVGHKKLTAQGGKAALVSFLESIGMTWALSLIQKVRP